jgi:hypothetical protein
VSTVIRFNLTKLNQKIQKISKNNVVLKVGFLNPEMAQVAIKNEFGGIYPVSPEYKERAKDKGIHLGDTIKIIPRPFMRITVDKNKENWRKALKELLYSYRADPVVSLNILGEYMVKDIQSTIMNNDFEENPAHIAKIKGMNKPLIDSGDMLNSVSYAVKQ